MTSTIYRAFVAGTISMACILNAAALLAVPSGDSDFDGDGDIDNFDLTTALDNYGLVGADQTDGDADADADVDADDFFLARSQFDSSTAFAAGLKHIKDVNSAKIYYNPANGALALDASNAAGGTLTSFILRSSFAFNTVNSVAYPFPFDVVNSVNLATRTDSIVAQTDPTALDSPAGFPGNPLHLGILLPPGLDLAGLQAISLRGWYVGAVVDGNGAMVGVPGHRRSSFQVVVIPEPAGMVIALSAALAVWVPWRRQRCGFCTRRSDVYLNQDANCSTGRRCAEPDSPRLGRQLHAHSCGY